MKEGYEVHQTFPTYQFAFDFDNAIDEKHCIPEKTCTIIEFRKRDFGSDSIQVDKNNHFCSSCNKVFASKVVFGMHVDIAHPLSTFECIKCKVTFPLKKELMDHDCL